MGHVARREGMHLAAPRGDETAVVVDGLGVRPVDPARAQVDPHLATQGRAGGSVCLAHRIRITPPLLEHPREMREDPSTKINRPRQVYTGETERNFTPISER